MKKTTRVPLASLFNTSFGVISSLVAATALISSCAPAPNSENTGTGDISFPIPEIHSLQAIIGSYPPIQASSPASGFESLYENSGQPKFNFIKSVSKRFGGRLNKGVSPSSLTPTEREKWQKIFAEIVKVADRNALTPKSLLEIDASLAMQWSIALETTGAISDTGAWTIAVKSTAVRHGFPNTPCAEFMSEVVRESYKRAGYSVTDDFSDGRGNELIWSNSAAVVKFSQNLYTAGWIPWESHKYRPPTGAIMLNGAGETPGHTYMAAGDDGRLIIDNSAPGGKDLREVSGKTIAMEYEAGVFFLPPGVNPELW